MRHEQQSGSPFLAFLTGAAVGAATALLLAPQSGRQTRDRLESYVHTGRHKTAQFQHAVNAASEAAREAFMDAMERDEAARTSRSASINDLNDMPMT